MKYILIISLLFTGFISRAQKTENIFLVTMDGFRWQELFNGAADSLMMHPDFVQDSDTLFSQFWHENVNQMRELLMPFFWQVIGKDGILLGNRNCKNRVNVSNKFWFSYPGYSEIFCGLADDQRITSNDYIPNPNQTIFEFINQQPGFAGKVASIGGWAAFPYIVNANRAGIDANAGFELVKWENLSREEELINKLLLEAPSPFPDVRFDGFTHVLAIEYIKKNKPRVMHIGYNETDDFAHRGNYQQYLQSAHQTDQFIWELWQFIQQDHFYKNKTTLIITTDHGRGTSPLDQWQHHNQNISQSDEVWLAFIGPDIASLGEVKKDQQYFSNQIASTLAELLGISFTSEGKIGKSFKHLIKK